MVTLASRRGLNFSACCGLSFRGVRMDSGPLIQTNGQFLREIPSGFPSEFNRQAGLGGYPLLPSQESVVREYLRILVKHKWAILSCIVLIFGAVLIATLRSTPIYEA